ncbi:MAG: hypothetical protein DRJ26_04190 [Candidatus Methanomethylicota archaeon]|uniref:Uncharacterized protein n=1 Tax=Thermoproteota archaeon TaxID=2056631 RepID=A0A497F1M8_9CREN|nr:MAG: hypothetical protein DRJ26_04190 [Candidatus Verstraetearchaeota archaeon]
MPMALLVKIQNPKMPVVFAARLTLSTIAAITGLEQGIIGVEVYSSILISSLLATLIVGLLISRSQIDEKEHICK